MSNRVKEALQEPEEEVRPAGDYYVVYTRFETYYVAPEVAARIGRQLDRRLFRPRWVKLADVTGSRAWVRADTVESIAESTEHQRQSVRDFQRSLRKEEKADRRWDEDEY